MCRLLRPEDTPAEILDQQRQATLQHVQQSLKLKQQQRQPTLADANGTGNSEQAEDDTGDLGTKKGAGMVEFMKDKQRQLQQKRDRESAVMPGKVAEVSDSGRVMPPGDDDDDDSDSGSDNGADENHDLKRRKTHQQTLDEYKTDTRKRGIGRY